MWWQKVKNSLAYILVAGICVYGCGGKGTTREGTGRNDPRMFLEKIHFFEVQRSDVLWEGWAQDADADVSNGRIMFTGVRLLLTVGGHQTWTVEGKTGVWEPEAKMIRSEETVAIQGPGVAVEGRGLSLDLSSQSMVLGGGVTASIEGFWLEQR